MLHLQLKIFTKIKEINIYKIKYFSFNFPYLTRDHFCEYELKYEVIMQLIKKVIAIWL